MSGEQDHALATGHGLLQILCALDSRQPVQLFVRCPPGHGGFEQANAQRGEMLFQQVDPLIRRQFWETQGQIDGGDATATTHDLAGPTADLPASEQLPAER